MTADLASFLREWPPTSRLLVLAPGPRAEAHFQAVEFAGPKAAYFFLDSHAERLRRVSSQLQATPLCGQAARLPFHARSFDALLAVEALFAVRPPWTVLAEFHRVLKPDGKLLQLEPAGEGFISMLRSRLLGPGKRVYPLEELRERLARTGFAVDRAAAETVAGRAMNVMLARKLDGEAGPAPTWTTARELYAKQKKKA
ncbi:MAG: class I SAM-dependent methyltransferase [Planctomycetota bacterium]|nr:class I SAM-dependent methyltransferase [Planctomycetota bacterium]